MPGRFAAILAMLAASTLVACGLVEPEVPTTHEAKLAQQPYQVTWRYGEAESQRGTLRIPAGQGPFPVIVLVHGGCWTQGYATHADVEPFGEALAQQGIAVWNIEYRQVGEAGAGWPGTFEDVIKAIDSLPSIAQSHPIDLTRVSFVGHSAGAHLVLVAAARPELDGAVPGSGAVRPVSVVLIDGPAELASLVGPDEAICGQPVIAPLMGGTPYEMPERYTLVSGQEYLPLGLRQLFVVGELGPFMAPYIEAARLSGDEVQLIAPANTPHLDLVSPDTNGGREVAEFVARQAFGE